MEMKSETEGLSAAFTFIKHAAVNEEECSEMKSSNEGHTSEEEFEMEMLENGTSTKCEMCEKLYTSRDAFLKHMKTHFEKFSCEICGKTFNRRDSFRRHSKMHEQKKTVCHVCGREFTSLDEKYIHLKKDHGIKRSELYSPEFKILAVKRMKEIGLVNAAKELHIWESTLSDWQRLVFNPLYCTFCGKTFTRENSLQIHVELVHMNVNTNAHRCDKCTKVFPSPSNLKRHLINCQGMIEKKEVKTTCDICHKTFSTGYGLVEHIRFVHEKQKNFVCEFCTKAFARRSELTYHVSAVHEKNGEFACGYCEKRYHREHEKTIHERIHTGEKPFVCDICGKAFSRKNSLQRHSQLHGEKPYVCKTCGEGYTSYKARRIQLACEKCHLPLTPVAPQVINHDDSNETDELKENIKQDVNSESLIRNRQGTDIDLRELYMQKFSNNEDVSSNNVEGLVKVEMKEGCNDEIIEHDVKEEPIDDDEETNAEEIKDDDQHFLDTKDKLDNEEQLCNDAQESKAEAFNEKELVDESYFVQTMEEVNQCSICQKIFTTKKGVGKHIRLVHRKERNYFCDICTKTFGRKEHLSRHINDIHNTFDKPHKCDKCDESFKRKDGLAIHVRFVHDKERNFCCDICTKTFARKADLTRHITDVHEQSGSFVCDFCPKRFYKALDKKIHERTHTGEKPYQCENCGDSFKGKSSVKKHALNCGEKKPRKKHVRRSMEVKEYQSPIPATELRTNSFPLQHGAYQQQHAYNVPFPGFPFNTWK